MHMGASWVCPGLGRLEGYLDYSPLERASQLMFDVPEAVQSGTERYRVVQSSVTTRPRVRDGMSGCGGLRGMSGCGDFARARRLPSRRVGLISDGVLGDDRVFTYQCVAAQPGSPQDAPSWSGTT